MLEPVVRAVEDASWSDYQSMLRWRFRRRKCTTETPIKQAPNSDGTGIDVAVGAEGGLTGLVADRKRTRLNITSGSPGPKSHRRPAWELVAGPAVSLNRVIMLTFAIGPAVF
tara:strand:+ start:70 stop:405 length:336 start_codon:yes stop_codon:yes gene_type:complete